MTLSDTSRGSGVAMANKLAAANNQNKGLERFQQATTALGAFAHGVGEL